MKLVKSPQTIQLPHLPENDIPVIATPTSIGCILKNNRKLTVNKYQIWLLLNFAITDYYSQGQICEYNIVDLTHCQTYQSIYTCLSRSSSLKHTLILHDFDCRKLKEDTSSDLRREY